MKHSDLESVVTVRAPDGQTTALTSRDLRNAVSDVKRNAETEILNASSEIRFISLWQPWASLVALNLKRYETRSWGTPYRGKLAIHAAKRPICDLGWKVADDAWRLSNQAIKGSILQRYGCIVAIVDLSDCFLMKAETQAYGWKHLDTGKVCNAPVCRTKEQLFEATGFGAVQVDEPVKGMIAVPVELVRGRQEEIIPISEQSVLELAVGDWQQGRYAWKLDNILALPQPIPMKGAQGLRLIKDADILTSINAQVREVAV